MSPHDTARLVAWLRGHGASDALVRVVGLAEDDEDSLSWGDRELWVQGRLLMATEPRVDVRALDDAAALSRSLGFSSDEWDALVRSTLGITEVRLRAHGILRLPLHATAVEVKEVHRAVVKALHPDRLHGATDEEREDAGRMLGKVNHARAVLLSAEEVVVQGEDDVHLGDPVWDADDSPTEVDLTNVLELLRE